MLGFASLSANLHFGLFMFETARSARGMVVAPHHLAAEAGLAVLREGGNAVEAMVAAAAAITVAYPHMNALGGDNFWLIHEPGKPPVAIDACGAAAQGAKLDFYRQHGHTAAIPGRGPLAALTVAGAVSGWQEALGVSKRWGGKLPLARLLADARHLAQSGVAVTRTRHVNATTKRSELEGVRGFADLFLPGGAPPAIGDILRNETLADTFAHLTRAGLDDFYRGDLARQMAKQLEAAGSPLRLADLEAHRAQTVKPLSVRLNGGTIYNLPPPTQGLSSLMVLGILERLPKAAPESFAWVHSLIEATKQAFLVRDAHVGDPKYMTVDPVSFLTPAELDKRARAIDPSKALPWPQPVRRGDTVWLGAIDGQGRAVSFIQSIYWEFGSGLVLPGSGIVWQNRGTSFSLDPAHHNVLKPGRKPFHTIQPALALLDDGRVMPYGTMGGEGQPQTQAMVFSRAITHGQDLQSAINAPRWLLGRTWGTAITNLRLENRFDEAVFAGLRMAGHDVEVIGAFDEVMGHAGALIGHTRGARAGLIEGAADPRSDGRAAGF
jgi:oxamate amidohydrolase